MLSEKDIAEELLLCQSQRKALQDMAQVIKDWDTALEQKEKTLRTLDTPPPATLPCPL